MPNLQVYLDQLESYSDTNSVIGALVDDQACDHPIQ
jgi:hypothetical protein